MQSYPRPAALLGMLGIMHFDVLSSDLPLERFLKISEDHGLQHLTLNSSMNKQQAYALPLANLTGQARV